VPSNREKLLTPDAGEEADVLLLLPGGEVVEEASSSSSSVEKFLIMINWEGELFTLSELLSLTNGIK